MATLPGSSGSSTAIEKFSNGVAPKVVMNISGQSRLKALYSYFTGNFASTFREFGSSTGYQVPVGKRFLLLGISYTRSGGSAGAFLGIQGGSSDRGFSNATTSANLEYNSVSSNLSVLDTSDGNRNWWNYVKEFKAGDFLEFYAGGGSFYMNAYGLELSAGYDDIVEGIDFTIDGQTFINIGRLRTLHWTTTNSGGKVLGTPRAPGSGNSISAGGGYTPPTGREFVALATQLGIQNGTLNETYTFETANADVGLNSSSTPGGFSSDSGSGAGLVLLGLGTANSSLRLHSHHVVCSAGRYFFVSGAGANAYATIYGYERNVGATSF